MSFIDTRRLSEALCRILPSRLLGSDEEYRRILYKVYGDEMNVEEIDREKLEISKKYLLIGVVSFILLSFMLLSVFLNEDKTILTKNGSQYISRDLAEDYPKTLQLVVKGRSEKEELDKEISVLVNPEGYLKKKKKEEEENFKRSKLKDAGEELKFQLYSIAAGDDKKYIKLPGEAGSIKNLTWTNKKDRSYMATIFVSVFLGLMVYKGRYNAFRKKEKLASESVERELAEFFSKMVLLINAGMVFTSAFEKTVEYGVAKDEKTSYFYGELLKIKKRIDETNLSIISELKKFSKRTENKEFIRIVNVISDNMQRGTELVKAMETESELISYQRKKRGEERARLAETKLTIPLAMQLLSLIIVTLAPALLDM